LKLGWLAAPLAMQIFHTSPVSAYPKFRNGVGKVLANASTPDFFGTSDLILRYAPIIHKALMKS
jgi:hypothetical protein